MLRVKQNYVIQFVSEYKLAEYTVLKITKHEYNVSFIF